jgi:phospholipid transport system transporter-binding protein
MIREGNCCHFMDAVTVDSVGGLLRELRPMLDNGVDTLDFSSVGDIDSAALALIFSAMRHARQSGHRLAISSLPVSFTTLAELYGVSALLPK